MDSSQQLNDQFALCERALQEATQTWFEIYQIGQSPLFTEAERDARTERILELVQRLEEKSQNIAGSASLLRRLIEDASG